MPQCCIVPLCSNSAGHQFPKAPKLLKAWLIAIRREKFTPTKNSRVCNKNFEESDYVLPKDSVRQNPKPLLKAGAIPSKFAWTGEATTCAIRRAERIVRRRDLAGKRFGDAGNAARNENSDVVLDEIACNTEISHSEASACEVPNGILIGNVSACDIENEVIVEEASRSVGIQCEMECRKGCITKNSEVSKCDVSTSTVQVTHGAFRIEDFCTRERACELHFYTGFDEYDHFMFVFNLLGPQAHDLLYYPEGTPVSLNARVLSPENEFFLTVMKLRRNMSHKELSFRFDISQSLVTRIFITWINFLYCQLKEVNLWASHSTIADNMRFKGKECSSTIIIDCTEIKIDKSRNPVSQQQTYSNYKSCSTLKVLVGVSPSGAITFISDAYGGSISDRSLFEKCGLSDKLEAGDIVLADRGFQIQDLLAHKDVQVNIPEFVQQNKGQLEPEQLNRSKCISSKRIHVERMIGLGKTYKILNGPLSANLVPLGIRIIFVCFVLANLRSNIVT